MENIFALRARKIELAAQASNILSSSGAKNHRQALAAIKAQLAATEEEIIETEQQLARECGHSAPLAAHHGRTNTMTKKTIFAKLSDQLAASGLQPSQRSDSMEPFSSFADQMQAIRKAAISSFADPRLLEINAALGGNESVPSEGGFLVVPEFAQGLIKRTYDVAQIASRCFKMPMSSNRMILHAVDEDSRVDGSRWGGLLSYWLAEAGTYTPTKPKFREMQFVSNKLIALCYATEEELADGPAWSSYINETVPQELAFQIDQAIFNGPGAGAPLGFMNSGALYTVAKDSGDSGATINTNDVVNMWSHLFASSRKNACWFVNQDIEPKLIPLTLGSPSLAQILLYSAPGINGNLSGFGQMFGRPVIPVEQASTLGTPGDIVLCDMTQYILTERMPAARVDTSIHVAFLTGEQAFRFMLRLDGQPSWKKPLTPYKGSAVKSPFIALAARS